MSVKKLDQLDAERLILTVELRAELLRAAKKLMPEAVRQARRNKPALLRMIARLAMRNSDVDKWRQ